MEKYQKEVQNLQLKIHGQFATIEHNDMNDKFYNELRKEGINIDDYNKAFEKLSDFYSEDYKTNSDVKEESDNHFVKEVVADMKRLLEIEKILDKGMKDSIVSVIDLNNFYRHMVGRVVTEYPQTVLVKFGFTGDESHTVMFYKTQIKVVE